jgi:hypothetical protein
MTTTTSTNSEPEMIAVHIDNNLAQLCLVMASIFEKLPPKELMRFQAMTTKPIRNKATAATVAAMAVNCGFVFAMQLRELQKQRIKERTTDDTTKDGT